MEQKLAIIKKAMEQGAKVSLSFYGSVTKEEAETVAEEIANVVDGICCETSGGDCRWFRVEGKKFEASVFFEPSKEDKIRDLEKQLEELKA